MDFSSWTTGADAQVNLSPDKAGHCSSPLVDNPFAPSCFQKGLPAIALRLWSTTPSLHPVSRTSSLLRVVPPLGAASVLSPSWFFHLWLLRSHRSPRFPRSAQSPLTSSGHLNAGCRFGP